MDNSAKRILIVGGGIVGGGSAAGFLARGRDVTPPLVRHPDRRAPVRQQAAALAAAIGAHPSARALSAQSLERFTQWDEVSPVVETIKKDLAARQQLFAGLDARVAAGLPIGSNSSGFPVSRATSRVPWLGMKSGKGFMARTPQAAQAVRSACDDRLAAALRPFD
jgi:3-hydroxybutyryl-CoA dehydrogenase